VYICDIIFAIPYLKNGSGLSEISNLLSVNYYKDRKLLMKLSYLTKMFVNSQK
jgi:hypothetical protein